MRVVFLGTPDFAVPSLEALAGGAGGEKGGAAGAVSAETGDATGVPAAPAEVALVVTRPDAVRGRGRQAVPSPVKARALARGLPVLEAARVTPEVIQAVADAAPDLLVVVAFGCILPDELLAVAPLGAVNVHASLLPRWRGAAPIQRAILAGDGEAGVSIMRVAHELDAGPWCRQASVPVGERSASELTAALAELGAAELVAALPALADGTATWHEQDEALVTYAAKVTKDQMLLDPAEPAQVLARRVRASGDTAPARCVVAGRGVRVTAARVTGADEAAGEAVGVPGGALPGAGAVLARKGRVLLGCAEGALELVRVRPDGKREMDARAFAAGLRGEGLTWGRAER